MFDCPIKFSEKSLQKALEIYTTKNIPDEYCLRVLIVGGGCAAVEYQLGFDKINEQDVLYPLIGDLKLAIAKKHLMYLFGIKVDYIEREAEHGFVFIKT
jgi:iron-sulfur cluster assembly accessory protein